MIPKINLDISNSDKKGRVVVAMSGGVDSSVAAALAKLSGYETIGVTLQLYDSGSSPKKKGSCCAGQDIHDAKKVASSLEIPHYVLNYEEIFKKKVIDDFALSYERGETPIPCVLCNEKVKFDDLFKVAKDLEADALVTGHYISSQEGKMGREMYRAKDIDRDQSYFLFKTTREQLEFLRFPLGGFTKPEIRKIADELGLVVSQKPDSQDICFVPDGKYSNVLSKLKPEGYKKGRIVSKEGDFLGDHDGIVNFTIGQRRGLGLATGEPLYVIDIDPISLDVTVGSKEDLKKEILHLRDVNWIGDEDFINKSYKVKVKIGSTLNLEGANLISEGNIGLMKAVERFDPNKGGKLSTYAAWWIKQSIKRALANQSKTIRLPVHMVDKISKMRRVAMTMSEELGREPTDDELSEEIGIDRAKLSQLKAASLRPASLDAPISEEDNTEFGEIVGDEAAQTPFELLSHKNMHGQLDGLLDVLDERERKIIDARFGLEGQKPKTLEEVGQEFGVTRERIRQLQNIALKKLRRALQKKEDPGPRPIRGLKPEKVGEDEDLAMIVD